MKTQEHKVIVAAMPDSLLEYAKKNPITQADCDAAIKPLSEPPPRKAKGGRIFVFLLSLLGISQVPQ